MSDRRYQMLCVVLAAVCLLVVRFPGLSGGGSGGLDGLIGRERAKVVPVRAQIKREVMIEFPILVLGGFRGPLVMGLWIRAEEEKHKQEWWNVKTYHEIIAHLQPNFPSVYVFNSWNLAYNLSVQWHEMENKYQWVQDGARYAQRGVRINPDSPEILFQLADICGQKLGSAIPERLYYRQQFRADTVRVAKLVAELGEAERGDLADGESVEERDKTALLMQERADGLGLIPIDLEEYPYGVSPFYFAYEYELRTREKGSHSLVGEAPIHARPAVTLMKWARSEMMTALGWAGKMASGSGLDRADWGNFILPMPVGQDEAAVGSVRWEELKRISLFHFDESERRFSEALERFKEHLEKYPRDEVTHRKHIYICSYQRAINRGRKNLFLGLCSILENDGKVEVDSESYRYLQAAVNDFKEAIGERQEDGSYPPESLVGYQAMRYPWENPGQAETDQRDRDDMIALRDELKWKISQMVLMGKAIVAGQEAKVSMSVLRLDKTEKHF